MPSSSSSLPLVAEALLQLPDAPLKDAIAQLPPIVWVTVGLLAIDGAALQVRMENGRPRGCWCRSALWVPCQVGLSLDSS